MLHRQLRTALEEIFGEQTVEQALGRCEVAEWVIQERPERFKEVVLGFQRLNYRDEQTAYARQMQPEFTCALICALLHNPTRELVAELGLNYL